MAYADRVIWVDGSMRPARDVTVPVLAQSLQRGTLVFDIFGVEQLADGPYGLGARQHVERFVGSCDLLDVPLASDADALVAVCSEVARANPGCEVVRLQAYWDLPSLDVLPVGERPTVAVLACSAADVHGEPRPHRPPARVTVPGVRKIPPDVLPTQAKVAAAYAHASVAKARARAAGFHDVVLLDGEGNLTESGTMSLFLVIDGVLRTAGLDVVLDGITRRVLLDISGDEGIPAEVGPLPRHLLHEAEEAFLASTSHAVWPIESADGERIGPAGDFEPGPVATRLAGRFAAVLAGTDPLAGRWLQPL